MMSTKVLAAVQNASPHVRVSKGKSSVIVVESNGEKTFKFDDVFSGNEIDGIYQTQLTKICQEALSGFDVSVTCCGQSGIGSSNVLHGMGFSADNGIVPAIIKDLFSRISSNADEYLISASMLQIDEGGSLTDVLNPHRRKMRIKHNKKIYVSVENLSSFVCSSPDEACGLYSEGCKTERALKCDQKDVIFTLYIAKKQKDTASTGVLSKITVLDLVGYEYQADNTGIKALFQYLSKGKSGKDSSFSGTNLLLYDAITNCVSSTIIACPHGGEESNNSSTMKLLEMTRSASGFHLTREKNDGDLTKTLAQLRSDIKLHRDKIMRQTIPEKKDVVQLEELISDLNVMKRTSWPQRIALSNLFVQERMSNLADRGLLWVLESKKPSNHEEIKDMMKKVEELSGKYKEEKKVTEKLKEDLKTEIDQYTKSVESGKTDEKDAKTRVSRIQHMKELFKKESEKNNRLRDTLKQTQEQLRKQKEAGLDVASFDFEMTVRKLEDDRNRIKKENQQLVDDEVEKVKVDIEHEKAELEVRSASGGLQLDAEQQVQNAMDLMTLKLEKSAITTRLDVLTKENKLLEDSIQTLVEKHTKQTEMQQLQNLQTFRAYREVFEEFKCDLESRWRGLLDDAIQDAVFLNAKNSELKQDNESLKLEVGRLKDALSLTGGSSKT